MRNQIPPQAIVRLVIYTLGALAGLAAAILSTLGYVEYAPLLTAIAGAAAIVTGGTAAYNIERTPASRVDIMAILTAFKAVADEAKTLPRKDGTAEPYVGQHRAEPKFSSYQGE
ncbi:hypothetical protein M3G47_01205 [Corynebacterium sanguinis]|uniref:hypothetical protein n=1 Tax=Corynebacterium sanguinis TaxID=2594913 RepID=UPI0021A7A4F4|nr:hypothetical protein [Corynebacterium sanguinis]MCT1491363.1 hypothetical protein [Corynebacterium sanguinis]MCT2246718.1 hypothetical protein [Corynebacterium sanguinis]